MKKIIAILGVLIFGTVAFVSVAFASHPCFIGQWCKNHILPPSPGKMKMTLINKKVTPEYFNAGEINPPDSQKYTSVPITVFLSNLPRYSRLTALKIIQTLPFADPDNPTGGTTKVLYDGGFRPQPTVDALIPENGGVVTLSAEVTYKPYLDILILRYPPSRYPQSQYPPRSLKVFASASSVGDTGTVDFNPIEESDIALSCKGGGFSWPQPDQETIYIATVPISAVDEHPGAASGINPKVEFTGSSFPNAVSMNNGGESFTALLYGGELDNKFTAMLTDNVGHQSSTQAFKIPEEKIWAAMQECLGIPYPIPRYDPSFIPGVPDVEY